MTFNSFQWLNFFSSKNKTNRKKNQLTIKKTTILLLSILGLNWSTHNDEIQSSSVWNFEPWYEQTIDQTIINNSWIDLTNYLENEDDYDSNISFEEFFNQIKIHINNSNIRKEIINIYWEFWFNEIILNLWNYLKNNKFNINLKNIKLIIEKIIYYLEFLRDYNILISTININLENQWFYWFEENIKHNVMWSLENFDFVQINKFLFNNWFTWNIDLINFNIFNSQIIDYTKKLETQFYYNSYLDNQEKQIIEEYIWLYYLFEDSIEFTNYMNFLNSINLDIKERFLNWFLKWEIQNVVQTVIQENLFIVNTNQTNWVWVLTIQSIFRQNIERAIRNFQTDILNSNLSKSKIVSQINKTKEFRWNSDSSKYIDWIIFSNFWNNLDYFDKDVVQSTLKDLNEFKFEILWKWDNIYKIIRDLKILWIYIDENQKDIRWFIKDAIIWFWYYRLYVHSKEFLRNQIINQNNITTNIDEKDYQLFTKKYLDYYNQFNDVSFFDWNDIKERLNNELRLYYTLWIEFKDSIQFFETLIFLFSYENHIEYEFPKKKEYKVSLDRFAQILLSISLRQYIESIPSWKRYNDYISKHWKEKIEIALKSTKNPILWNNYFYVDFYIKFGNYFSNIIDDLNDDEKRNIIKFFSQDWNELEAKININKFLINLAVVECMWKIYCHVWSLSTAQWPFQQLKWFVESYDTNPYNIKSAAIWVLKSINSNFFDSYDKQWNITKAPLRNYAKNDLWNRIYMAFWSYYFWATWALNYVKTHWDIKFSSYISLMRNKINWLIERWILTANISFWTKNTNLF